MHSNISFFSVVPSIVAQCQWNDVQHVPTSHQAVGALHLMEVLLAEVLTGRPNGHSVEIDLAYE